MLSPGAPKGSCCRFAGQLLTLNSHWRLSGGTGAVLCVRRPGPQAPPCPALSFTHTSRPSFCYGRGFTLALPKRSQHATLPDSASLPPQETDTRAGLSRGGQTAEDRLTHITSRKLLSTCHKVSRCPYISQTVECLAGLSKPRSWILTLKVLRSRTSRSIFRVGKRIK